MTDAELAETLRALGMDVVSWRALPLLPLVQVAWADGRIQDAERDLILELARSRFLLEEEGQMLLRNWLHHPPTPSYVRLGQDALVQLCNHNAAPIGPSQLGDVVDFAKQVAAAAGGFYGFGAVGKAEAEAIEQIAGALHLDHSLAWSTPDDTTMVQYDADQEAGGPSPEIVFHDVQGASRASLVRYDLEKGEQSCPITAEGVTIGRARENVVQISYDGQVSRQHCQVFERNGRFYVKDLESTCGTWVNGERVVERRLLGGEKIHVGSGAFFFQLAP